jgi:hypothetical protein
MLSGSIAMGIYILPRATKDIDFVVNLRDKDIEGLLEHFAGPYYVNKEAIADAINHQSMFNIIDHESGFKADFVVLKNDKYRLTEFERRQKLDFYGTEIYVVSPEDLLLSKLIRVQDWQAAVQMEDIRNLALIPNLHNDYIKHLVKTLKLNTFNLIKL